MLIWAVRELVPVVVRWNPKGRTLSARRGDRSIALGVDERDLGNTALAPWYAARIGEWLAREGQAA